MLKHTVSTSCVTLCLGFGLVFVSVPAAHAQSEPFALTISPPLTHIIVQPGRAAVHTVTLTNEGTTPLSVTTKPFDFTSDQISGEPVVSNNFTFPYLTADSDVLNTPFPLSPGEQKELVFRVDVPETAIEKEHHFILLFSATANQEFLLSDPVASTVATEVASTVITTITRTEKDLGLIEIERFSQARILDSFQQIAPEVMVKNVGKNMTVTTGTLEISNPLLRQQVQFPLFPENILPNSTRILRLATEATLEDTPIQQGTAIRYRPTVLLGIYTITLTYHSPNQSPQQYQTTVFAFPFSILLIFVAAFTGYLVYSKSTRPGVNRVSRPIDKPR